MNQVENVYRTIKRRSNFIIKDGNDWKKEISSAKNYITTPDFKHWTFGKSAGLDYTYHSNGGTAKKWLYSLGFIDVLKLPNSSFKSKLIEAFYAWVSKVESYNILEKYNKDQVNNKRFELLVHHTIIPKAILEKTDILRNNQTLFTEGFRKEITREVAIRDRRIVELAKRKYGTKCMVCKFDFSDKYGIHGHDFIEVHHLNPISLGKRKTTVDDLRPVCANCHRMLHKGNVLLSIQELRKIIKEEKH